MKQFYIANAKSRLEGPIMLDAGTCRKIALFAPIHILTKDLEAWRDGAQSGDVFEVNSDKHVLCLDLEEMIAEGKTAPLSEEEKEEKSFHEALERWQRGGGSTD